MTKKRVLFYSHDTFGLGHIRRTQKLANQVAGPDVAILVICSSPKASDYRSQPGIEFLNLPGFTKLKTGQYTPRNLNLDLDSFVKIRSEIILATVKAFAPDVFIVDKEPLGVKRELLDSLLYLRSHSPQTHTICGIRDILDDPANVAREWARRGSEKALLELYDSILVYGDQRIYDLGKEYALSPPLAKKLHYMGYITQDSNDNDQQGAIAPIIKNKGQRPLVTFSLGGGEDGDEFLAVFLLMLEQYKKQIDFHSIIVTGPFLGNGRFKEVEDRVAGLENVELYNFIPNMFDLIGASDALVTMGGYNTFCECLSLGKTPIILPRVVPRTEQLIRAKIFKAIDLCDYIHPDDLNEGSLFTSIKNQLAQRDKVTSRPQWDGLKASAQYILNCTENQKAELNALGTVDEQFGKI